MKSVARAESRNIDRTRCKYNPNNRVSIRFKMTRQMKTYPVIPQRLVAIHAVERDHPQTVDDKLIRKHRGVHFYFHDVDGWIIPGQLKTTFRNRVALISHDVRRTDRQ